MNRVCHLALHDVRAQRLSLAVFAAFIATEAVVIVTALVPTLRSVAVPWMPLARGLFTSLIAALIIQRDPLVDTTAFWRTRPIGRAGLFASKLLSLVFVPAGTFTRPVEMAFTIPQGRQGP